MQSRDLIHWGGLALLVGGVLYTVNGLVHLDNNDPQSAFSPLWFPVQLMITIFYALSVVGLLAPYRWQREKAGKLGLVGCILAIIGSVITLITSIGFTFVIPAVAAQQPNPQSPTDLIGPTGPLSWIGMLVLVWVVAFIPGYIMTGIATMRAGILPRWAGMLVSIGMVLVLIGAAVAPVFFLRNVGGVMAGIGLAWLGYALWAEKGAGITTQTVRP